MSEWYRLVRVSIPKGREEQFLEVYHHNGWMVEDLQDEAGGCHLYKVWIPESKVSEVRGEDDLERSVLRTSAPKGEPDG